MQSLSGTITTTEKAPKGVKLELETDKLVSANSYVTVDLPKVITTASPSNSMASGWIDHAVILSNNDFIKRLKK
jgi:hypothetical protein